MMVSVNDLAPVVGEKSYPGRGIIIGKSADGENFAVGYFIMGRSENSRNRIFERFGENLRTKAFDESKMVDPSLIIYNPVLVLEGLTVVTNGDQTDTVFDFLKAGKSFEEALYTRTFEPDAPNFTPRISGLVDRENDLYKLSILKTLGGDEVQTCRYFYNYKNIRAGQGHFIHTYMEDGDPLPSFCGEPKSVKISGSLDAFTETLWQALDSDNKVSLFTRFINIKTGEADTRIINKNA